MDADPYLGEIRMFAGNYPPRGWALCNGQSLSINSNNALFTLIGKTYGGVDGNFNLPDLRGRVPVHQGNGSTVAQMGGSETVTITKEQMPPHSHLVIAQSGPGTTNNPVGGFFAGTGSLDYEYTSSPGNTTLANGSISTVGDGVPYSNFQPFLTISFIIALSGIYPSPNP